MVMEGFQGTSHIDNLDDRRELFVLLSKLTLREQTWFMNEVGRQAIIPFTFRNDSKQLNETYVDFLTVLAQFRPDASAIVVALESFVSTRTAMSDQQRMKE